MKAVSNATARRDLIYRILAFTLHFQQIQPRDDLITLPNKQSPSPSSDAPADAPESEPKLATELAARIKDHLEKLHVRCRAADIELDYAIATTALALGQLARWTPSRLPPRLATELTGPRDLPYLETATLRILEAATELGITPEERSKKTKDKLQKLRIEVDQVNQSHYPGTNI